MDGSTQQAYGVREVRHRRGRVGFDMRNLHARLVRGFWKSSLVMMAGFFAGCSGFTGPRDVTNPDPHVKVPEIRRAVVTGDRSTIPQLIIDLDNPDPAIRLFAILGLERLTGETFGYRWEDQDRIDRADAIGRWKAWQANEPSVEGKSKGMGQ